MGYHYKDVTSYYDYIVQSLNTNDSSDAVLWDDDVTQ